MPEVAAVVVAGSQRGRAQRCLDAIAGQTAAARMECVLVDIGPEDAAPLAAPATMPASVVRRPGLRSWAGARAAGVRAASAPVVAFVEDHAYPEPEWAAAIAEAMQEPWAAIGYGFRLANPATRTARANHLADYGMWLAPVPDGEAALLPGNNCAYRRSVLLDLGERMDPLLGVDFPLHEELRARGHRLGLAAGAVVRHESAEAVGPLLAANRAYCRVLAEERAWARGWSRRRRLAMALAVPVLVPPLKALRLARALRGRPREWAGAVTAAPILAATWVVSATAEAAGYVAGAAGARERFLFEELEAPRTAG